MKDVNALFGMVDHRNVEAMAMHWRKLDLWKAGIVVADVLLFLVLMLWVPVSVVGAQEIASGLATPVTVQATPTVDATVTALNKEKLQHGNDWWWNYGATILTSLISTLTLAAAGIFTVVRYFNDRRDTREKQEAEAKRLADDRKVEREKRAEERFQAVVEGLSSEREEAKIGAAILLRTFLRPGYEQFYAQTFDLVVANLRLSRTLQSPADPDTPLSLTTLRQALIIVFKESFPLARSQNERDPQSLDATGIQLDNAYLRGADLEQVWIPQASLREADLSGATLNGAIINSATLNGARFYEAMLNGTQLAGSNLSNVSFRKADLNGAILYRANLNKALLNEANLRQADLRQAKLIEANLSQANLSQANLSQAKLFNANLNQAKLFNANLSQADLSQTKFFSADLSKALLNEANLSQADLSQANLSGSNIEDARSLKYTNLRGVKGLTKEQLEACKAKGAIIDEDPTTSSSQSTVAPPPPSQSNDAQTSSSPPAQGSLPPPATDESSTVSSQQEPES